MTKPEHERRTKERVKLDRPIFARFGQVGVIVLDLTEKGARIEHLVHLPRGRTGPLRFDWERKTHEATAEVKASRVHRFASGDDSQTVYQSGLEFTEYAAQGEDALREMTTTIVARSLADQVANLRGSVRYPESEKTLARPAGEAATDMPLDRGYLRCNFFGDRFDKKWCRTPEQPVLGFTISAAEPPESVDQLCDTYLKGNADDRKLIGLLARLSISK